MGVLVRLQTRAAARGRARSTNLGGSAENFPSKPATMPDFRTRWRQWRFGVIAAATGGRQVALYWFLPVPGIFSFNLTIEVQQNLHVERLTN